MSITIFAIFIMAFCMIDLPWFKITSLISNLFIRQQNFIRKHQPMLVKPNIVHDVSIFKDKRKQELNRQLMLRIDQSFVYTIKRKANKT